MKIKKTYFIASILMLATTSMIAMKPPKNIILENNFSDPHAVDPFIIPLQVKIRDITDGESQNAPIIWNGFLSSRSGYTKTINIPFSTQHMRIRIANPESRMIVTTAYLKAKENNLFNLKKTIIEGELRRYNVTMWLNLEYNGNNRKIMPLTINWQ